MAPSDFQATQADAQADQGAPAQEPAQPPIGQGKAPGRKELVHLAAIKKAVALDMIGSGASLAAITKALGYTRKSKTVQLLERGGIKVPSRILDECAAKRADDTEADPSGLTDEQMERAFILGISPGRFAHLLTCQHSTSPFSHAAPGNAYTRNIL